MTQDELKMVLEALEDFADVIKYENEQDDIGRKACCDVLSYKPHYENCKAKQAITAIEEALAQPEQEPVATLDDLEQEIYENTRQFVSRDVMEWMLKRYYTTPPQRTWVGLTDEEISEVLGSDIHDEPSGELRFIRAIEAKLKQKNGYTEEKNT